MLPADAFDNEGFLRELGKWSPEVAIQIALTEELTLTNPHWEVINLLREY